MQPEDTCFIETNIQTEIQQLLNYDVWKLEINLSIYGI